MFTVHTLEQRAALLDPEAFRDFHQGRFNRRLFIRRQAARLAAGMAITRLNR